ncbi:PrgI family protein [Candidatus Parcubacteria bacterium]|nr:PrgI family protein [Candidatus Parcubacteria bacterium]
MKFQVPQYIEVEDKIFGSLTFKQFVYIAGGVGICVLLFTFLPMFLAILLSTPVAALSGALAFYKYNDKPFVNLLEAGFKYATTDKLYVWRKGEGAPASSSPGAAKPIEQIYVPKLSQSKLKDLSWSLDIKENANPITQNVKDEL